jgi:hypothetical protein
LIRNRGSYGVASGIAVALRHGIHERLTKTPWC